MSTSVPKKDYSFAKKSASNLEQDSKKYSAQEKHNFKFFWKGINKDGNKADGVLLSTSLALAKSMLIKQGFKIDSIKQESILIALVKRRSLNKEDITRLTRQLATMVEAGIPILQTFDIISRGSDNIALNDLVLNLKSDVQNGIKLSTALQKYPKYFSQLFCALVEAGEEAGALSVMLERLATYMEKTESMRRKIKKALFYPTAVVVVGFVVSGILLLKVVPQFKDVFASFGAKLPAFTQAVLNLSNWTQNNIGTLLCTIAAIIILYKITIKRSIAFRRLIDKLMLKLPVVGVILTKGILARFARTLATTFSSGMPLIESLKIVAKAPDNLIYESAVNVIRRQVTEGKSLFTSMEATGVFPNIMIQMVGIGEESGALDSMLNKAAQVYEEEVDNAVDSLSALIEPLIMGILGTLVGGLVIAMYLPIFQLGAVVGQ